MIARTFLNLCLLRANPQDLPATTAVMALALLAHFFADVVSVLDVASWRNAVAAGAVDTVLLAALTHVALMLRRLEARVKQTLTALAGCGAALALITAGAVALLVPTLPWWAVWTPFLLWYLAVFGHILRHAFDIPFVAGIAAGVLYLLLSIGVTGGFLNPEALLEH